MSILEDELEERYPIEDGDTITMTRSQLALQLRRAYKAGAMRDYTRTPQGVKEFNAICSALHEKRLLPDDADFEAIVDSVIEGRMRAITR